MSTANERFNSAFLGAFAATVVFFLVSSLLVALANGGGAIRTLNVEAPDFVAVSKTRRGSQYMLDITSRTCYSMFGNATGISFAPVDCDAIGVDPHSIPRTGQ